MLYTVRSYSDFIEESTHNTEEAAQARLLYNESMPWVNDQIGHEAVLCVYDHAIRSLR